MAKKLIHTELGKRFNINDVEHDLSVFIWTFKHADNITYNFNILENLYLSKGKSNNSELFNKPITIIIVSIIECILVDLLDRVNTATNHLPHNTDKNKMLNLKNDLQSNYKKKIIKDDFLGDYIVYKRKLYSFKYLINTFKKYNIFDCDSNNIYDTLSSYGDMRNRVHIENHHNTLELNEADVFTNARLKKLEKLFSKVWLVMTSDFKRPWKGVSPYVKLIYEHKKHTKTTIRLR